MYINQLFSFLRNTLGFALFWNDHFLHFDISPQNEKSCFPAAPPPNPPKKQLTNPFVSLSAYPVPSRPRYGVLKGTSTAEVIEEFSHNFFGQPTVLAVAKSAFGNTDLSLGLPRRWKHEQESVSFVSGFFNVLC